MAPRPDLLGARSEPTEFSWTPDDVMLYALAVGAGSDDPLTDLALTTENTEGLDGPRTLPSYANIVTRGATVEFGKIDRTRLVHAEQSFRLHAPLPAAGRARVTAAVVGVEDTSSGVLVRTEAEAVDATSGTPLASTVQTVMLRGESAGGPRAARAASAIPEREPDHRVVLQTRPDQALLYRLTGDRNPLHSDPAFARRGGFERPILHGMCTYGFTARALVHTVAGGDPDRLTGMAARFTRPVLPGDALEVAIWLDEGGAHFRTTRDGEPVLDRGWADIA